MTTAALGGPILKAVSRSFYLTIRLLPAAVREPIGLAYLLARTSDTIADSASASTETRLRYLADFERMVQEGARAGLPSMAADLRDGCTPGERALLGQVGPCLDWLESLPRHQQTEIRTVLSRIVRGQRLDLQRFDGADAGHPVALATAAELDEYTYLVAGCVGEFWTRVCLHEIPRYARLEPEPLVRLGVEFGQGLQLVNILRDRPADLRQGRSYLPPAEAAEVAAFDTWLARAFTLLESGEKYLAAVRPVRVKVGCYLPWSLGVQTLRLLEAQPPAERSQRVKVPRRAVYRTLLQGVWAAVRQPPHRRS